MHLGNQSTATLLQKNESDLTLHKNMAVDDAQSTGTAMNAMDNQSQNTLMGKEESKSVNKSEGTIMGADILSEPSITRISN